MDLNGRKFTFLIHGGNLMSSAINTNVTAIGAAHNLNVNNDRQAKDIERLSTGLRINSAADDAAGLVISQNMNGQLVGLNQATSNTNDAVNQVKTAEAALGEVQNLLMSMRGLAVNASNQGVNDNTDLAADQQEISSAVQSIDRISLTTQFGSKKLLDGSANSAATITAGSASVTGSGATITSQGRWSSNDAADYSNIKVTGATSTTATVGKVGNDAKFTGKVIINDTTYDLGSKGLDIAGINTAIEASGYTATVKGGKLAITSGTGGEPPVAQSIDTSLLEANGKGVGTATVIQGQNASIALSGNGHTLKSVNTISNGDGSNMYVFENGLALNATAKAGDVKGVTLHAAAGTASRGQDLQYQIGANMGQTTSISIRSTASSQIGLNAGSYVDANGVRQNVATDSVANVNVSTFKGAQDSIAVIDKAITDVSKIRADLGAFQSNVLQSNINSLSVASENLSSSKSTITDADMAETVVSYTKDSILVQSATSALSYANQKPQQLLKLLQ
jgi:flagellin